jgi:hypothetical protein
VGEIFAVVGVNAATLEGGFVLVATTKQTEQAHAAAPNSFVPQIGRFTPCVWLEAVGLISAS